MSSVNPRAVHPPLGLGEGVLDNDICGSSVGVEGTDGIGVRERANALGSSPRAVPDVGDNVDGVSVCLVEGVFLLPEERRRVRSLGADFVARACGILSDYSNSRLCQWAG